jgi:hypothetical protein
MEGGGLTMPQPYPIVSINTSESLIIYAFNVTGGWITTLFAIACFVILFFIFKNRFYRNAVSLAASSVCTMILCSFLWALGVLNGQIIMLFVVITLGTSLWTIFDKG